MLVGNLNFFHAIIPVQMFQSQLKAATGAVNGVDVVEPWKKGRELGVVINGGAMAANSSLEIKFQGKKRSDGTYADLLENDGVGTLQVDPLKLDDAAALETGVLIGTLDLNRIDSETYSAIRAVVTENGGSGGGTVQLSITGLIFGLYRHPSGTVDELFDRQRYGV